jgi:H/ACA ribonucleoprotein complex subunit 3
MTKEILFCKKCHIYTLEKICPKCNEKTISPKPGKYSPEDKYGKYRRLAKSKSI